MMTIRIVHDPYANRIRLFFDKIEITSQQNKIYGFMKENGLEAVLYPFNRRYTIWRGLLPELLCEANDSQLEIIFEGREKDFFKLEEAFEACRPMVNNLGYENQWTLCHIRNFENENMIKDIEEIAGNLLDMCESRAELYEIDRFVANCSQHTLKENIDILRELIYKHQTKWEFKGTAYAGEKITFLQVLAARLDEISEIPLQEEI